MISSFDIRSDPIGLRALIEGDLYWFFRNIGGESLFFDVWAEIFQLV